MSGSGTAPCSFVELKAAPKLLQNPSPPVKCLLGVCSGSEALELFWMSAAPGGCGPPQPTSGSFEELLKKTGVRLNKHAFNSFMALRSCRGSKTPWGRSAASATLLAASPPRSGPSGPAMGAPRDPTVATVPALRLPCCCLPGVGHTEPSAGSAPRAKINHPDLLEHTAAPPDPSLGSQRAPPKAPKCGRDHTTVVSCTPG